jgi:cobalt-zinc-cadmium efflux system outer membrane protein
LRPDLQSAQLAIERSRAQFDLAKAQRWEDWTAGLGVFSGQTVFPNGLSTGTDVGPSFVLTIPLPLWNKNQGRIAEAVAMNRQASAEVRALTLQVQNEVAGAYSETERLLIAVDRYRNGMLKLSDRNMLLAQQAYMTGQASILTAVQAQRQHGDQHIAYLNTMGQYLQAWVALRRAVGEYLESLNRPENHDSGRGERIHE